MASFLNSELHACIFKVKIDIKKWVVGYVKKDDVKSLGYITIVFGIVISITYFLYFIDLDWIKLDKGGLLSLAFTVALLIVLPLIMGKRPKDAIKLLKKSGVPSSFIMCILIGVASIGLWLSVRNIGLLVRHYLFEEKYLYSHYEILDLVAYALATQLCFTLFKTVKATAEAPLQELPTSRFLRGIVDTAIQAVLIAIIVMLPRYGDERLLGIIGDYLGYVSILLCMALTLVLLVLARKYIKE